MFRGKRGQELSTTTIILIILGVIVLVILAAGFFMGWDKFKGIFGLVGGDSNVGQIAQACQLACTTQSQYDFCTRDREIKVGKDSFVDSCKDFADPEGAYKEKEFGIDQCPSLC